MRRLRRVRGKKQKQILIVSTLVLFSILTIGYAAFQTNISLTAKGNVSPTITYTIDDLKSLVTDVGDGLYIDSDEQGRYVYKGADPDNYLKLGNDDYRIMGIESDGSLKVIKTASISKVWDPGYSSNIDVFGATKATSTTTGTRYSSVSTDFCYDSSASNYYGCKVWGSADTMRNSNGILLKDTADGAKMPKIAGNATTYNLPNDEAYINYYLNNEYINSLSYKELIETHSFDVGPVANTSGQTLATDISQAHAYTWQGKVGLMTVIDYVKANTNTDLCGTVNLSANSANGTTCKTTNYLYKIANQWTMSPYSFSLSNSYFVWLVYPTGNAGFSSAYYANAVRPVLYLADCVQLSGNGTSGSPYTITNSSTCQASSQGGSSSGSGGSSSSSTTVYAINTNTITKNSSTLQDIGTTYSSCAATGKTSCLRYTIENDTVTGAEACFVKGGAEYCLTGWHDECLWDDNADNGNGACTFTGIPTVFNSNKSTLQTAFTESGACYDHGSDYSCITPGLSAISDSIGYVGASDGSWGCWGGDTDGTASCGGG